MTSAEHAATVDAAIEKVGGKYNWLLGTDIRAEARLLADEVIRLRALAERAAERPLPRRPRETA